MLKLMETCLGNKAVPSPDRGPPLDMEHLLRQTQGDVSLSREVLSMFVEQTRGMAERLERSNAQERRELAHALVGSARGIGAFQVAESAARIEKEPDCSDEISRLSLLLHEAHDYIVASR